MNLALWLARAGMAHGERPAVAAGERVALDYRQLAERAARLAGAFRDRFGLRPGDRVAVIAKNAVEYTEILFGIWHAGLAAVPANAKLHGAELAFIIENSGARICLAGAGIADEVAAHAPASLEHLVVIGSADYQRLLQGDAAPMVPRDGNDLAWLFYTSGTTGRPKGAMLTHRNLLTMTLSYLAEVDPARPGDAIIHAAPMSHGSGLYMMAHVLAGGIQVIPGSGGFEPEEIFRLAAVFPRSSMFAAPTMVKRLTECPAGIDPALIRTIIYGGGPMYVADALATIDRFGPRIAQIYGQGESPMTITTLSAAEIACRDHPRHIARLGSVGLPFASVEVIIADGDDRPLPAGETGEVLVRGDTVMAGYWQNEAASKATLRGGWLHTGDVGSLDEDGFLTLKDRSKDVIISGGSNIYPREVEEVLLAHPGVTEASVIGRPDAEWGEIVVAYVVGKAEPGELDRLCLQHIARFKRPKHYVFLEALPKNNYGKVLKTALRDIDDGHRS
ncbi:MAG: AMP-binding protein [Hyphomicrobiales bacterium]